MSGEETSATVRTQEVPARWAGAVLPLATAANEHLHTCSTRASQMATTAGTTHPSDS